MKTTRRRTFAVSLAMGVVGALTAPSAFAAAEGWHGVVGGDDPNVRGAPSTGARIVGTLRSGTPLTVQSWVAGEMVWGVNATWARIAPGRFVYSALLAKPRPPAPPPAPRAFPGHWIDVNLTEQIISAYDGARPAFWHVTSTGAPGWETPSGVHRIRRRVANETMNSATLTTRVEVPYLLRNVLWTQYFDESGDAIHDNYWKGPDSPFGVPTSHGRVGLPEEEAYQFWKWARVGTIVNIHT